MADTGPLYLGLDLSTQQLKVLAVNSHLETVFEEAVSFDKDLPHYGVRKGVFVNEKDDEVYAPVAMWIEALDLILERMKARNFEFERVKGISGAGQQHGSVYWSTTASTALSSLDPSQPLLPQLSPSAFSWPYSPNWQDHSTSTQVAAFTSTAGSPSALANSTGSSAHHRFTGPQILRFLQLHPTEYASTSRISLVSSFLASLFLGSIAPIDISDVCGMNLFNIPTESWDPQLIALAASPDPSNPVSPSSPEAKALLEKLGDVEPSGGKILGRISSYYQQKYAFPADCAILPSTGDNPSTILALPLHPQDAIVSLGTSTTILMSTEKYVPSDAYHMFNHPAQEGLYMFMLCYKNGGLAREEVRDGINKATGGAEDHSWNRFNEAALNAPVLGRAEGERKSKLGFYFPLPEIVPNVTNPGFYRFTVDDDGAVEDDASWDVEADARAILESQALSMRIRSAPLLDPDNPQPRRVYIVGGGSRNKAIARMLSDVLGGKEGVFELHVGNACALGAAYKALWAVERKEGETFEEVIGARWDEKGKVEKVVEGYTKGVWEKYDKVVKGYLEAEGRVVRGEVKGDTSLI